MVYVSWYDAARYANWLSKQFKRDIVYIFEDDAFKRINYSAKVYRLPTEVEWSLLHGWLHEEVFEYAGSNELDSVAWNSNNSGNRSQPVAGKKANSLGLYDMSGNVWEWCGDWRADYPAIFPANYHGPEKGWSRVIRGGSWNLSTDYFRLRNNDAPPDSRYYACGFRLAFTP